MENEVNVKNPYDTVLSNDGRDVAYEKKKTSILSNSRIKSSENKIQTVQKSLVKRLFNPTKFQFRKKSRNNQLKEKNKFKNKFNKICIASCIRGTVSSGNSPIETEETSKNPFSAHSDKMLDKNLNKIELIDFENERVSYNSCRLEDGAEVSILTDFQKVSSNLSQEVDSGEGKNLSSVCQSLYSMSVSTRTEDSSEDCGSNPKKGNDSHHLVCTSNEGPHPTRDSNTLSKATEINKDKRQSLILLSTDGSLRFYSKDTLTPLQIDAIRDEETILAYLNKYKLSLEASSWFEPVPSDNSSEGSDSVFFEKNSSPDSTYRFQPEKRNSISRVNRGKLADRDSGYDPQFEIKEEHVLAPPPSPCSTYKYIEACTEDECTSESPNKSPELYSGEESSHDSQEDPNIHDLRLNSYNKHSQTQFQPKSCRSHSEGCNTEYNAGNVLAKNLKSCTISANKSQQVSSKKYQFHYNEILNSDGLKTLNEPKGQYEYSDFSKNYSSVKMFSHADSRVFQNNISNPYIHDSKKISRQSYRAKNQRSKSASSPDEIIYTLYGWVDEHLVAKNYPYNFYPLRISSKEVVGLKSEMSKSFRLTS